MKPDMMERRRHSRAGLFARIEDVTFEVLRRAERENGEEAEGMRPELAEDAELAVVNVTFGRAEGEQLGEPF